MKKATVFFLVVLLVAVMCACSNANTTYTVIKGTEVFEVDPENHTVSDGTYLYEYEFSGDTSSYRINITYPNGASYYWNFSGYSGHGGWSDDYDDVLYTDGDTLCDVIVEKAPKPTNPGRIAAAVFLIVIGIFNTAAPHTAWYLGYGWRYKNAEPSELALGLNRIIGITAIIVGAVMIFI